MSPRRRALLFGGAALLCAALAAAAAGTYGSSVQQRFGDLRQVVVTRTVLHRGASIKPGGLSRQFEVRRVPADFAPPDALSQPSQALGAKSALALPQGSYLTQADLAVGKQPRKPPALAGRSPVELTVSGGAALSSLAGGRARVDVVVTTEPGPGPQAGRTYVAARGVPLLDVRRDRDAGSVAGEGGSIATLALKRAQALQLIRAESFARSIRLLAR